MSVSEDDGGESRGRRKGINVSSWHRNTVVEPGPGGLASVRHQHGLAGDLRAGREHIKNPETAPYLKLFD